MNDKDLNIALGKLFNGIELDTHKVELGLVDDFKSSYKNYVKQSENIADEFSKFFKLKTQLENDIKKNINNFKSLVKPYEKIEKQAKELGLNIKEVLSDRPSIKKDIDSMEAFLKLL